MMKQVLLIIRKIMMSTNSIQHIGDGTAGNAWTLTVLSFVSACAVFFLPLRNGPNDASTFPCASLPRRVRRVRRALREPMDRSFRLLCKGTLPNEDPCQTCAVEPTLQQLRPDLLHGITGCAIALKLKSEA